MKILNDVPAGYVSGKGRGRTRDAKLVKLYATFAETGTLTGLDLETGKGLAARFNGWVRADSGKTARVVRRMKDGKVALFILKARPILAA